VYFEQKLEFIELMSMFCKSIVAIRCQSSTPAHFRNVGNRREAPDFYSPLCRRSLFWFCCLFCVTDMGPCAGQIDPPRGYGPSLPQGSCCSPWGGECLPSFEMCTDQVVATTVFSDVDGNRWGVETDVLYSYFKMGSTLKWVDRWSYATRTLK
jgi:hypothetical protein